MPSPSKAASKASTPSERSSIPPAGPSPGATLLVAWLVPGAGHFLHGQSRKAVVFFVVLVAMFFLGLSYAGRLFPFQLSEPLVFLAAAGQWMSGAPRLLAAMAGWGAGTVTMATYEYGNTFLIVSGLLNALVALDARDLAAGRKPKGTVSA